MVCRFNRARATGHALAMSCPAAMQMHLRTSMSHCACRVRTARHGRRPRAPAGRLSVACHLAGQRRLHVPAAQAAPVRAATEAAVAAGQNRDSAPRRGSHSREEAARGAEKRRTAKALTLAASLAASTAESWRVHPSKVARAFKGFGPARGEPSRREHDLPRPSRTVASAVAGARLRSCSCQVRARAREAPRGAGAGQRSRAHPTGTAASRAARVF